jgi:hypothetical protein
VAEGGGLLNRYRVVKPYRGFESLRLRQMHGANYLLIGHNFRSRWFLPQRRRAGACADIAMTALIVCDFAGRKLRSFCRLDFEHSGKFANDL